MKTTNKLKHFRSTAVLIVFSLALAVRAQDLPSQAGFISLDCGRLPSNTSYSELTTSLVYISDESFIDTGESKSLAPEFKVDIQEQAKYVRAFPQGIRNCYRINVSRNTKYLIRATFLYGNYDGLNKLPEFDLHLGVTLWDTVKLVASDASEPKEVVHVATEEIIQVCLANTGSGTPFISSLELRPLNNSSYVTTSGSLSLIYRVDVGATFNDSASFFRYPFDVFDRVWLPFTNSQWSRIKISERVRPEPIYNVPSGVMSTAATPMDPDSPLLLSIWSDPNPANEYFVYMYFSELQQLKANESRGFNLTFQGQRLYGPLIPMHLNTTSIYTQRGLTGGDFTFTFVKLENSTLPPILNAFELFKWVSFSQSETEQNDASAMRKIKSDYGLNKNWDADPCVPITYLWQGLNCSYEGLEPPRITSLNLSSSGLTGVISSFISNLTFIESLDLSNNSLIGLVPDSLAQLSNLKILNLERNNLSGSVPAALLERAQSGSLLLSIGENPNLNCSVSCANAAQKKDKNNNVVVPIVAAVGGVVFLVIAAVVILAILKRNKNPAGIYDPLASKKRPFSFTEIINITNNFEKTLGKGGFGTVYLGVIDENTKVAVKLLSKPKQAVRGNQRSQAEENDNKLKFYQEQFEAEVMLLMRVHHTNLLSLVGYCNEEDNKALIYEFMANGDLDSQILDEKNPNVLGWDERLQIALDSAQGLEYMHNGCKPQIVHRDVKCTNILLDERFNAKIADFGLSRVFPTDENATHVSTKVAGTPGYLDPEYYTTNWLNEKSDVFSFGVVLLEIITGRPAISRNQERTHIIQWVNSMLANGDIKIIVEPKLSGNFDTNTVWKAVELALACVARAPSKRPTMSQVVTELKECLSTELARRNNNSRVNESTFIDSDEIMSMTNSSPSEIRPLAR